MKCLNCGMDMNKRGFCPHCGYMTNGIFIDTKKIDATLLKLYFEKDYDKYVRNENKFFS